MKTDGFRALHSHHRHNIGRKPAAPVLINVIINTFHKLGMLVEIN